MRRYFTPLIPSDFSKILLAKLLLIAGTIWYGSDAQAISLLCKESQSGKELFSVLDDHGVADGCVYFEDKKCSDFTNFNSSDYYYYYGSFLSFHSKFKENDVRLFVSDSSGKGQLKGSFVIETSSSLKINSVECNE